MSLTYRSRLLPSPWGAKYVRHVGIDIPTGTVKQDEVWNEPAMDHMGGQTTGSEGHPWRGNKDHSHDIGGEFYTAKRWTLAEKPVSFSRTRSAGDERRELTFRGPLAAYSPDAAPWPDDISSSRSEMNEYGATAVARCKPTNSVADASTFLGELIKDHLPMIPGISTWERKLKALVSVGDEFLNVTFGWLPLLNDVQKLSDAVRHADTVLRQFERDAGKLVRRQYRFPVETSKSDPELIATNVSPWQGAGVVSWVSDYLGVGDVYRVREKTQQRWFSGGFTYYLPNGNDYRSGMIRNAREADKVFGTNVTPETLWELTPWSWAIDWFSNAGDVISNISDYATYGLVMRYGYIMETSSCTDTYSFVRSSSLYDNPVDVPDLVLNTTIKTRYGANPFGFGLTWEGLSPIQTAIAGALGLTHAH